MVKEGPCRHCGIEQTPLWRNGPPEKQVLCNACGSWWRTRGTLNGYTPKHGMKDVQTNEASGSGSTVQTTTGPSQVVFENAPRRQRSFTDQYSLTPVGQLTRQLLEIVHQQPEVYLNRPVDEDVLIATSNPPETALGAVLLVPPREEGMPTTSQSLKTEETITVASELAGNSGDQGEPPAI